MDDSADPVRPVEDPPQDASEAPARVSSMETVLHRFSEGFHEGFSPLIEPLSQAATALAAAPAELELAELLPAVRDLSHQMQVLIERVAEQQAYVLIFGPLKSGKSTFMNAMCSSYVSEVTSLPAYPCLVHVSHGEQVGYTLVRYDGSRRELADAEAVHRIIDEDHKRLMQRSREVEAEGRNFDPAVDMPQALRKIEVRRPLGDLANSGAVLVDTPGLYSRMKFGYDRMTRDFRDVAAGAIFIVKTDNLFLEQVFEEFQELLGLFSRVFLVVNLDSTKRDLRPDGTLAPSLEQQDPERIVEAFRDLSMSAALREAHQQGRLHLYPVDLLGAATKRMRGDEDTEPPQGDTHAADPVRFETLLKDLTDYLNSSEYLREFLGDSVRRARSLLGELRQVTGHAGVRELRGRAGELEQILAASRAALEACGRLREIPWSRHAGQIETDLKKSAAQMCDRVAERVGGELSSAIEAWFNSDQGLAELNELQIVPMLNRTREMLLEELRGALSEATGSAGGGMRLSPELAQDFGAADLKLEPLIEQARRHVDPDGPLEPLNSPLSPRGLPVRRGFWDWLLLRTRNAVRRKIFGPASAPGRKIPPDRKRRKLGSECRDEMLRLVAEAFDAMLDEIRQTLPRQVAVRYGEHLCEAIGRRLEEITAEARESISLRETQLKQARAVLGRLDALAETSASARSALERIERDLSARLDENEPDEDPHRDEAEE